MDSASRKRKEMEDAPPLPPLPPPSASASSPAGSKRKRDVGELSMNPNEAISCIESALSFLQNKADVGEATAVEGDSVDVRKWREAGRFDSRTVESYEMIRQVGLGTYGEVYKARDRKSGEIVALKKIIVHNAKDGYPVTALREIKIMQQLRHKNVLELKDIVPSKTKLDESDLGTVYMVLEYLDNDLTGILENRRVALTENYVKCYMKQLLEGIHYIHTNRIVHRDLKAANILVGNDSRLKIGDWGLARSLKKGNNKYTTKVVTLWYRAPELLLGVQHYTPAIDVWAVGCIFAELLGKRSILPGENEVDQLQRIFDLCGTPTEETWPGVSQTPVFKNLKPEKKEGVLEKRFSWMKPLELDLLKQFLVLDPRKRITAEKALDHDYFWKGEIACAPEDLPRLSGDGIHEFELKEKRRLEKKEKEERQAQAQSRSNSRGFYPRRGGYHQYHQSRYNEQPHANSSSSSGLSSTNANNNSSSSHHNRRSGPPPRQWRHGQR